jgi:DNA-binding MarR family transcriptional regulator
VSTVAKVNIGEIPFSTTLEVRDTCVCLHVQRAARVLARRFDAALKPVSITNGQFSLLMSLNRPIMPGVPRATMGNVAELLGMDRTTLTASARVLVRRGLMKVIAELDDRRSRILVLTAEGRTVLAAALPIWKHAHEALERELGREAMETLRQQLNAIAKSEREP